jgi:hypothetical protein
MDAEIQALLKEAQQEVKRAAGIPLSPEEEIADLQQKEMDKMESFVLRALGVARTVALSPRIVWGEEGPETRMNVDSQVFWLRKRGNNYVLFAVKTEADAEIASIEASDPIWGSRVMVAIGNALQS